ncbi:MAG: hypothetical protein IJZ89_05755 [Clostridia bacterium]|nr:hypothetical protein [Clostridia bacterium]
MKIFINYFLVICLITCLFMTVATANYNQNTFLYGNKEITIIDNSLDYAMMKSIADYIANDNLQDNGNTTYAIGCLLTHDIAQSAALQVDHCVYDTAPRCVETQYIVTYCTRGCGYMEKEVVYEEWIFCCE